MTKIYNNETYRQRLFMYQGIITVQERLLESFWKYITVHCTLLGVVFIPIEITYSYSSRCFKMIAMCDKFNKLDENTMIPEYNVQVTRKMIDKKTGQQIENGLIKHDGELYSMTDGDITIEEVIEIEGFEKV